MAQNAWVAAIRDPHDPSIPVIAIAVPEIDGTYQNLAIEREVAEVVYAKLGAVLGRKG
jgi:hypothetical protein